MPTVAFSVQFKNAQFEAAAACWVALAAFLLFAYIVIISLCLTAGDIPDGTTSDSATSTFHQFDWETEESFRGETIALSVIIKDDEPNEFYLSVQVLNRSRSEERRRFVLDGTVVYQVFYVL